MFVYLIRYGVLKWSPVYLSEVKHFNIKGTAWAYTIYELAAVPGTLLCGWVSDKVFKGKRGLTGFIFMILTTAAVVAYWMNPATPEAELANYSAWYENPYQLTDFVLMTLIGFLIYGPVMLIGLHALELAPKKSSRYGSRFHWFIRLLRWYCISFSSYWLGCSTLRMGRWFLRNDRRWRISSVITLNRNG